MDPKTARAIIAQAKADDMHDADPPEADADAVSVAEGLVKLAQDAWDANVRGPEVEKLLNMAKGEASESQPEPKADPEPEPPSEPEPEYEKPPTDTPPVETETPAEEPPAESADLSQIEPWDGYSEESMGDVKDAIDAAVDAYTEDELRDLMANLWAYEAAHRNRKGVMKKLEEVAEKIGAVTSATEEIKEASGEEAARAEEEQQAAPQGAGAEEASGAGGSPEEAGASGGEEVQAADRDGSPDASAEPGAEAPASGTEGRVAAESAAAEDGRGAAPGEVEPSAEYDAVIRDARAQIERERLHVPPPIENPAPDVPFDLTKLSDKELQQLYSAFTAYAYRVAYELHVEDRIASLCREAANELHRELLVLAEKYDEREKQKTMTILEAEIENDENVKKWRKRQRLHETFASSKRSERESYNRQLESFSRLETMRHDEWERSGAKAGRSRPGS